MNMIPIIGPTTISTGNEEPSGLETPLVKSLKKSTNLYKDFLTIIPGKWTSILNQKQKCNVQLVIAKEIIVF